MQLFVLAIVLFATFTPTHLISNSSDSLSTSDQSHNELVNASNLGASTSLPSSSARSWSEYGSGWLNCTQVGEQLWTEVWASNFDNVSELTTLWDVQHETSTCHRNGIDSMNCNTRDNIEVIDGYAWLIAKHETFFKLPYTGATMTTKTAFTHGRYEVRARLPRGDFLRPSIFTRNDTELYWHENGQMDLGSYGQDAVLFRGIHYAHSTNKYQQVDLPFSSPEEAWVLLGGQFHLYGVEWSAKAVRFFWDSSFTKWYNFTEALPMLAWHNIRLQIGVGGVTFPLKMPENFTDISWTCPALIVDHVKIYEKVESRKMCENVRFNTEFGDVFVETHKIDKICKNYEPKEKPKKGGEDKIPEKLVSSFQTTQWIIVSMVILFAVAIFWMMFQLRSVRRKLDGDAPPTSGGENANAYSLPMMESYSRRGKNIDDEEQYEEIDNYHYHYDDDGNVQARYVPYLPLEDVYTPNEYLVIHDEVLKPEPVGQPPVQQKAQKTQSWLHKKPAENDYTRTDQVTESRNDSAPEMEGAHYDVLKNPVKITDESIL